MNTSEQINELAAALAKAQAAIKPAIKDATNPHFGNRYADLAGVWAACREPLSSNGLSVVQMPVDSEAGRVALVTTLLHSSGQWISSMVSTRLQKDDAQGVGSALTYLKRYALSAMVGVVADDDDDGNKANQPAQARASRPATFTPAEPVRKTAAPQIDPARATPMSDKQGKAIYAIRSEIGYTKERFIDWLVERKYEPTRLSSADASAIIEALKAEQANPTHPQVAQPSLADEYDEIDPPQRSGAVGVAR